MKDDTWTSCDVLGKTFITKLKVVCVHTMETDDCLLNFLRRCSKTSSMDVKLDVIMKVGESMLLGMTISCSSVSESQPKHFLWVYNPSVLNDQSFLLKRKNVDKLLLTLLDGKGGSQSFKNPYFQ